MDLMLLSSTPSVIIMAQLLLLLNQIFTKECLVDIPRYLGTPMGSGRKMILHSYFLSLMRKYIILNKGKKLSDTLRIKDQLSQISGLKLATKAMNSTLD